MHDLLTKIGELWNFDASCTHYPLGSHFSGEMTADLGRCFSQHGLRDLLGFFHARKNPEIVCENVPAHFHFPPLKSFAAHRGAGKVVGQDRDPRLGLRPAFLYSDIKCREGSYLHF